MGHIVRGGQTSDSSCTSRPVYVPAHQFDDASEVRTRWPRVRFGSIVCTVERHPADTERALATTSSRSRFVPTIPVRVGDVNAIVKLVARPPAAGVTVIATWAAATPASTSIDPARAATLAIRRVISALCPAGAGIETTRLRRGWGISR